MVDPVNSNPNAISTLLRAQTIAPSANVNSIQRQVADTSFSQAVNKLKPTVVQPSAKVLQSTENLPRGSLLDILV